MLNKLDYIKKHGENAWKLYLENKRKESHVYYQTHRAAHTKPVVVPVGSRKAVFNGYTYYVTEDGQHFYNSYGKERPIQKNKQRKNRQYVKLNQTTVFFNIIMANAYPEICGEWFDGCEVHHIDGNKENDAATNLKVMSKEEHHRLHDGLIKQYDNEFNLIGEYSNSTEAAAAIGDTGKAAAIRMCLAGKTKSSCGYIWKREP